MDARRVISIGFAVAAIVSITAMPAGAVSKDVDQTFATVSEAKQWAARSFFGGARTETFSRGTTELLVITGMPTSGLLTSQLLFFGRDAPTRPYRMLLTTGIIHADARAAQDDHGVSVRANGKLLLVVPFEIVTADSPEEPPRLPSNPPPKTDGASRRR